MNHKQKVEMYDKNKTCPQSGVHSSLCRLFVDLKRLSDPALREHLQLDSPSRPELSVQTFPYESVYTELQAICAAHGHKDKVWICDKASCALTQVIPKVRGTNTPRVKDRVFTDEVVKNHRSASRW